MKNAESAREAAEAAGRDVAIKKAKIIFKGMSMLDNDAVAG